MRLALDRGFSQRSSPRFRAEPSRSPGAAPRTPLFSTACAGSCASRRASRLGHRRVLLSSHTLEREQLQCCPDGVAPRFCDAQAPVARCALPGFGKNRRAGGAGVVEGRRCRSASHHAYANRGAGRCSPTFPEIETLLSSRPGRTRGRVDDPAPGRWSPSPPHVSSPRSGNAVTPRVRDSGVEGRGSGADPNLPRAAGDRAPPERSGRSRSRIRPPTSHERCGRAGGHVLRR
jgi:hypothetical protein